jgi:hypothetical protein
MSFPDEIYTAEKNATVKSKKVAFLSQKRRRI